MLLLQVQRVPLVHRVQLEQTDRVQLKRFKALTPKPRGFALWAFLCALIFLQGCVHTPATLTLFEAFGSAKSVDAIRLNSKLSYLRVSRPDKVVLMVLGYVEALPEGNVEIWYSSVGEVLKLQNGRVLATVGFEPDWRKVTYKQLPTWQALQSQDKAEFERTRDQMPGYKFGILEAIKLYKVPAPRHSRLTNVAPTSLTWFEESVQNTTHGLPSARYGVSYKSGEPVVVYGEQCFSVDVCISWQKWPASL